MSIRWYIVGIGHVFVSIFILPRSFRSYQSNRVFLMRIIRSWIGITSLKSTPPCSGITSLCTRDDVTMVDECKQSTTTPTTHVKKTFKWTHFTAGWKREWIYTIIVYVQEVIWSMHFKSIKRNNDNRIGESHRDPWRYLICIISRGLCSYNARFWMMTSRQSRSPIGGEGNCQATHGSIVVEYLFLHATPWIPGGEISIFTLLFTSEDRLCASLRVQENGRIWRHNASVLHSRDVIEQLWWRHNTNSQKTVLSDNNEISDRRLCVQGIK